MKKVLSTLLLACVLSFPIQAFAEKLEITFRNVEFFLGETTYQKVPILTKKVTRDSDIVEKYECANFETLEKMGFHFGEGVFDRIDRTYYYVSYSYGDREIEISLNSPITVAFNFNHQTVGFDMGDYTSLIHTDSEKDYYVPLNHILNSFAFKVNSEENQIIVNSHS